MRESKVFLSDTLTLLTMRLWKPEPQLLIDCMDNAYKFVDKWVFQETRYSQPVANTGGSAGARTPDSLIKSTLSSSNISDLTPKSMQTNADKMVRRDMLFFSFKLDKHI